jgi:hypothetical protein
MKTAQKKKIAQFGDGGEGIQLGGGASIGEISPTVEMTGTIGLFYLWPAGPEKGSGPAETASTVTVIMYCTVVAAH